MSIGDQIEEAQQVIAGWPEHKERQVQLEGSGYFCYHLVTFKDSDEEAE